MYASIDQVGCGRMTREEGLSKQKLELKAGRKAEAVEQNTSPTSGLRRLRITSLLTQPRSDSQTKLRAGHRYAP